jgi:hypothetical protein
MLASALQGLLPISKQLDLFFEGDYRPAETKSMRAKCRVVSELRNPRTDKVIFRPSVTSSGRTRKKSRMQAWLSGLSLSDWTTEGSTSFQSFIWIAKIAKHTQSWTRMGLGPAA